MKEMCNWRPTVHKLALYFIGLILVKEVQYFIFKTIPGSSQ